MDILFQNVIAGLETGSLYALAALGLVLIFRTSDVVNFAQGEMAMFSSFIALKFFERTASYPVAFLGAILFACGFGFAVDKLFMQPAKKASLVSRMIITLGLVMVLNGLASTIFGIDPYVFPKAVNLENLTVSQVVIQPNSLFIIFLTLSIMGILFFLMQKTMMGIGIRATAQNENTARLMGIRVDQVYSLSWMIATVLGAVAGVLVAPMVDISTTMMAEVHLKSFIAAVLGGFGSFVGPVVGGFIIGVLDNLVGYYVSLTWKTVIVYGLLILVLIIKPTGLFGKTHRKKV